MEWQPLRVFEGYEISENGDIRTPTGRIIKCRKLQGYRILELRVKLHRAVLLSFVGNPPEGQNLVRHLDGNKENNSLTNLAWGTHAENTQDAIRHGTAPCLRWKGGPPFSTTHNPNPQRGELNLAAKLKESDIVAIRLRAQTEPIKTISKDYPVSYNTILRIVRGKKWAHVDAPITNKYKVKQ